MNDGFPTLPELLLFVLAIAIYFAPGIIAKIRGHHNYNAILALNLFLGWTLLGWVIAFVWAYTQVKMYRPMTEELPSAAKKQRHAHETIRERDLARRRRAIR